MLYTCRSLICLTAQYLQTPPPRKLASSSSTNGLAPSPTVGVNQRRSAYHEPRGQQAFTTKTHKLTPNVGKRRSSNSALSNSSRNNHCSSNTSAPLSTLQPAGNQQIELTHAPPVAHGIQLVSLNDMPDRFRSVFSFPLFNAIQSKCFPTAYKSNDNLVVSAPTGGGKTAILEMAVCRLVAALQAEQYKIVYMAPTKSLCSERQRDWQAKFAALDLRCAELTGDTDGAHLRSVQSANIIITTPEKWDSMTRKWKDHAKLMCMVRLFLIDEVHILKDIRGATLEAVVSRMKSVGPHVRFVALSATVPNSDDIATWLGKDSTNEHLPAIREIFGEELRPVRLQKHVVGLPYRGSDFGFEGACDPMYTHQTVSEDGLSTDVP